MISYDCFEPFFLLHSLTSLCRKGCPKEDTLWNYKAWKSKMKKGQISRSDGFSHPMTKRNDIRVQSYHVRWWVFVVWEVLVFIFSFMPVFCIVWIEAIEKNELYALFSVNHKTPHTELDLSSFCCKNMNPTLQFKYYNMFSYWLYWHLINKQQEEE